MKTTAKDTRMKDILLANGFVSVGPCGVCGGHAWEYRKGSWVCKVKIHIVHPDTRLNQDYEKASGTLKQGNRNLTRVTALNLMNVLIFNKLAESTEA